MTRRIIRSIVALAMALLATAVQAQSAFPSRPVKFIIPYPTGAIDTIARQLADRLSKQWGQPIVVENRAGGSGIPAMLAGKEAPPDGYTLLMGASGPMAGNPALFPSLPYDPVKDYVMVSGLLRIPLMIVAHPDTPYNTLRQMLEAARQAPGKLDYGTPGSGTANHLTMELLKSLARVDIAHIPYKGPAQQMTDLISGQTRLSIIGIAPAFAMLKAGRMKALAVTMAERFPPLPNVPTVAEEGYPGFEGVGWGGLLAPLGTPQSIVDKVGTDVRRILADAAVREQLFAAGMVPDALDANAFRAFVENEIVKWKKVAVAANVKAD